jgi:hypothetical protein
LVTSVRRFVFAFLGLLLGFIGIYEDGTLTEEGMRLWRVARLEHGKSVLQLTDSVTHAGDPTV